MRFNIRNDFSYYIFLIASIALCFSFCFFYKNCDQSCSSNNYVYVYQGTMAELPIVLMQNYEPFNNAMMHSTKNDVDMVNNQDMVKTIPMVGGSQAPKKTKKMRSPRFGKWRAQQVAILWGMPIEDFLKIENNSIKKLVIA